MLPFCDTYMQGDAAEGVGWVDCRAKMFDVFGEK
jgi:hypothetical protein